MTVLVCGSRSLQGYAVMMAIHRRIGELPRDAVVLHGGAHGPDTLAYESARDQGLQTILFAPDWKTHGRRAGILRNLAMLDTGPDLVIAYWDGVSAGTRHTIAEAERRGIPVEVHARPGCSTVGRAPEPAAGDTDRGNQT